MKHTSRESRTQLKKLISRCIAGDLYSQEQARLEKELAAHPDLECTFKSLQRLSQRPAHAEQDLPLDFEEQVMQRVQSIQAQGSPGLLSRIFSLPSPPAQMALALMITGIFFLAVGFQLVLGLDTGQDFFYAALAPAMVGATLLACHGIHMVLQTEGFGLDRLKIFVPGALFGGTTLMGVLPGMSAELMLISLWFGLSGMGITVFLAMASGCFDRHTAQ